MSGSQQKADAAGASTKSSNNEPNEVIISTKAPSNTSPPASKVAGSSLTNNLNPSSSGSSATSSASSSSNAGTAHDAKESSNSKAGKDVKDAKETKESKDSKDAKDAKESKESKDGKEPKDSKSVKQIVQVGVFTDPVKIKEYRAKLEKAGFKTTTRSEPGKDGVKRIRIKVVPFKNKEEAQRAMDKIKEMKIPGAQLNLIPQP
jgi:hypothetical protein